MPPIRTASNGVHERGCTPWSFPTVGWLRRPDPRWALGFAASRSSTPAQRPHRSGGGQGVAEDGKRSAATKVSPLPHIAADVTVCAIGAAMETDMGSLRAMRVWFVRLVLTSTPIPAAAAEQPTAAKSM